MLAKKAGAVESRSYTFLGLTQSLCPECLAVLPTKIIVRHDGRVYFRKRCPTHGPREDFVCSDVTQYDRLEFTVPGKTPRLYGVEPDRGCPLDCGLCTEHEQHTCIGLVEITSNCNLSCPMCYAESGPGGRHLALADCRRAIDRLVQVEGRPEVLQLSGGEPTIHPQFAEIFDYACQQPIDYVMVNTNGVRLAHDTELLARLAEHRQRTEVYLQFDGLRDSTSAALRGESLLDVKLRAVEQLGRHDISTTLVVTLQGGVNDDEIGAITRYALERPWITGLSFQPATYSGRHVLPAALERRVTFPDVIRALVEQTDGLFTRDDFLPLPCAHPNCHQIGYVYRSSHGPAPLTRFIDAAGNLDLLANGISFTRPKARALIERYLGRLGCCAGGDCGGANAAPSTLPVVDLTSLKNGSPAGVAPAASEFFARVLTERLGARDIFRITITSFLDAYNFDVRRVMKCCVHQVLPSGHVVPFCAYNVLYRNGHVSLPELRVSEPTGRGAGV